MPTCENCDSYVSERFRAVFGDNDGLVHACRECESQTDILNGEGANV